MLTEWLVALSSSSRIDTNFILFVNTNSLLAIEEDVQVQLLWLVDHILISFMSLPSECSNEMNNSLKNSLEEKSLKLNISTIFEMFFFILYNL